MAGRPIDELAVVISASTEQLAGDLARGARMFRDFSKLVERQQPPTIGRAAVESLKSFGSATRDAIKDSRTLAGAVAAPFRVAAAASRSTGDILGRVLGGPKGGAVVAAPAHALAGTLGMVGDAAGRATGSLASFTGGVLKVAAGTALADAGIAGLSAGFGLLKESVALAGEAEQTQLAFETMLGSAEKAQAMLGQLRQYAASTPFGSKETIDSARQLVAYGIAADQVVPTIKMLGDVAAGTSTPLKDLNYLYGTLYSQQRAYAVDIRQFAGRGIPIYESLAKVLGKPVHEIKDLVEQGRIGRDEVTRAFVDMTSAGGRFYRLTERQGQTFKGRWESMLDAFQLAKTKFGVVLIEELGLKDVANDMSEWARKVEGGMDRVRPVVRAVGDSIKGIAQGLLDAGRGAMSAAPHLLQAFGMGKAADGIKTMMADVQGFLSDPERVGNLAIDIAEPFVLGLAQVREAGQDLKQWLNDNVIQPIRDMRNEANETIEYAKKKGVASGRTPGNLQFTDEEQAARSRWFGANQFRNPLGDVMGGSLAAMREQMLHDQRFGLPYAGESPAALLGRLSAIHQGITTRARELGATDADLAGDINAFTARLKLPENAPQEMRVRREEMDRLIMRMNAINAAFVENPTAVFGQLQAGQMPAFRPGFTPRPNPFPDVPGGAGNVPEVRPVAAAEAGLAAARARIADLARQRAADKAAAAEESARQAELDRLRNGRDALFGLAGITPSFASQLLRPGLSALNMLGVGGMPASALDESGVRIQGDPSAGAQAIAQQLKQAFANPLDPEHGAIGKYLRDAAEARQRGLITDHLYQLGLADTIQKEAQRFGIGGEYKLPSAATVGSAEDAKILTNWMSQGQNGQRSVEGLLQRLLDAQNEEIRQLRAIVSKMGSGGAATLNRGSGTVSYAWLGY